MPGPVTGSRKSERLRGVFSSLPHTSRVGVILSLFRPGPHGDKLRPGQATPGAVGALGNSNNRDSARGGEGSRFRFSLLIGVSCRVPHGAVRHRAAKRGGTPRAANPCVTRSARWRRDGSVTGSDCAGSPLGRVLGFSPGAGTCLPPFRPPGKNTISCGVRLRGYGFSGVMLLA